MPTYEYEACDTTKACPKCRDGFEIYQPLDTPSLTTCPECGSPLRKCFSAPAIGRSQSSFDQRAKEAGFSKLQRIGKGEYEKKY